MFPIRPFLDKTLRSAARTWLQFGPKPNLAGDRTLEWGFVAAALPPAAPGQTCLDFGCSDAPMLTPMAALAGYQTTGLDLLEVHPDVHVPGVRYVQSDLNALDWPAASFDVIINCSSIEHVGLGERYGQQVEGAEGDIRAMQRLRGLLRPGGRMILTLPVGRDAVIMPLHRVYGPQRLPRLLAGWRELRAEFYIKDLARRGNTFFQSDRATAYEQVGTAHYYGLGLFVLANADDAT
jgi:SAM-dependent methyltransferase